MLWKYQESKNESFHEQGMGKVRKRLTGRWALLKCIGKGIPIYKDGGGVKVRQREAKKSHLSLEIHGWWFYKSNRISCQPSRLKEKNVLHNVQLDLFTYGQELTGTIDSMINHYYWATRPLSHTSQGWAERWSGRGWKERVHKTSCDSGTQWSYVNKS